MKLFSAFPKTSQKSTDVISAEGTLPVGCKVKGGKIIPALSPSEFSAQCSANVSLAHYAADKDRYFLWADGKVYVSQNGTDFLEIYDVPAVSPFIFDERGDEVKTYIAGDTKCVVYHGTSFYVKAFNFPVCRGIMKSGRLFGVDPDDEWKLRWSGEGGAFDWEDGISGAGWVCLSSERGKILNFVTLGDRLIAVREHGLTVISAFGTPENFKVTATDTSLPQICKNTAAVVRNNLLFFAESGLYAYDGAKISKIDCALDGDISSATYAAACGNEYFLCGESKSLGRKAVLVYNADDGSAYIADVPATAVVAGRKVFAYTDVGACVLKNGGGYSFTSGEITFNSGKRKVLNRVEIGCDGEVDVEVTNGVKTRIFEGVKDKIHLALRGKSFKITVRGTQEITFLKAYAEVNDGI